MKFFKDFEIGEVCGDKTIARQCYLSTVTPKKLDPEDQSINQMVKIDPQEIIKSLKELSYLPLAQTTDFEIILGCPDKS